MFTFIRTVIRYPAKRKKGPATELAESEVRESDEEEQITRLLVPSKQGELTRSSAFSYHLGVPNRICIYKVLANGDPDGKAYFPRLVCIGPLHHDTGNLKDMQDLKLMYLEKFLGRCPNGMRDGMAVVLDLENKVRDCYGEEIKLNRADFATMLLLDGGFIIELLLRYYSPQYQDPNDYMFRKPRMIIDVRNDMILLENQLPFFVLKCLLGLVTPTGTPFPSLHDLTNKFFEKFVPYKDVPDWISQSNVEHFTSFLRMCQKPTSRPETMSPVNNKLQHESIPRATKLYQAGFKFKASSSKCILDTRYKKGELEIPKLRVDGTTKTFFRNLAAFERLHNEPDTYIGEYICLMDGLIENHTDVDLLVEKGIIDNRLRDSIDVVALFNNFSDEITLSKSSKYYYELCAEFNKYCDDQWHSWMADLMRDYFSTPWRAASTIAAIILLALTLIQTIVSLKGL